MKIKSVTLSAFQTVILMFFSLIFILFSKNARIGAYAGLKLALNTVTPVAFTASYYFFNFYEIKCKQRVY